MAKLILIEVPIAEIQRRIDFADQLIDSLIAHNRPGVLPEHLEKERQELLAEKLRRQRVDESDIQL